MDGSQSNCERILHGHDRQKSGFSITGLPHSSAVCSSCRILSSPFYYCFKLSCGPLLHHCSKPFLTRICRVPLLPQNHGHISPSSCCPSSSCPPVAPAMPCSAVPQNWLPLHGVEDTAGSLRSATGNLLKENSLIFKDFEEYNMWENCRWSELQSWSGGDTPQTPAGFHMGMQLSKSLLF